MSKTLTKQYYDLELEEGFYYAEQEMGNIFILEVNPCREWLYERCKIICKVPDYDQFTQLGKKVKQLENELSDAKEYCDYSINNREQLTKQINYWMDKSKQHERRLDKAKQSLVEIRELAYKGGHPIEALDKILDISSEIIRQLNQGLV